MMVTKQIAAEDVVIGDLLEEGPVVSVTDNYDNVECVDIKIDNGDDLVLTYRYDDVVEVYMDVA